MDEQYAILTIYVVVYTTEILRLTRNQCIDIILDAAKAGLKSFDLDQQVIAEVGEPQEKSCKLGIEIQESVPVAKMISLTNHIATATGDTFRRMSYEIKEITPSFEVITNLYGTEPRPDFLKKLN
jgi:hypothetical protein